MSEGMQSPTERLVRLIRDRALTAGDALPSEVELAAELRVSRNTVREALRELRTLGIVEVRRGFGTYVGSASLGALGPALVFRALSTERGELQTLRDLVELRALVETGMMNQLAGRMDGAEIERLRELSEAMSDPKLRQDADRAFHTVLYERFGNPFVSEIVDLFWNAYHEAQAQLDEPRSSAATVEMHGSIVDALESGDAAAAKEAMSSHFANIRAQLGSVS